MSEEVDEFLKHFGVKGMHWGHRKAENAGSTSTSAKPKKLTRKEVRAEKNKFYEEKASRIFETAAKGGDNVLIRSQRYGDVPTIYTGTEFANHMINGGLMNVRMTDVFATLDPKLDQFVLNETPDNYVRSDKKK